MISASGALVDDGPAEVVTESALITMFRSVIAFS
jgi:hypothetical protein